jgi:hypothetical protein
VYTYTSGAKYEGEWRDNLKDGRGVYYFPKVLPHSTGRGVSCQEHSSTCNSTHQVESLSNSLCSTDGMCM